MALPAQVLFGTVTGTFVKAIADTADAGTDPDAVPLQGQITFTPNLVGGRLKVTDATPPATVIVRPVPVTLDVNGVMSVQLIADPTWTWEATFSLTGVYIAPFTFQPIAGQSVDLTLVAPAETANGGELYIAQAVASAASAAASAASAALSASLVGAPADAAMAAALGNPASLTRAAGNATYLTPKTPRVYHLNVYDAFFAGQDSVAAPARWMNSSHMNATGLGQWAAFVAAAADETGAAILTGRGATPKVTWLGDSWVAQDPSALSAATLAVVPGATVVNAGIAGNTSTQVLARFDTDVPADSKFVIFNEPGVNDCVYTISDADSAANLEALVAKCRRIGAVPIFTGMVPQSDYPTTSAAKQAQMKAQIGDGTGFPGVTAAYSLTRFPLLAKGYRAPEIGSLGLGDGALAATTTGTLNTAFGGYGALLANTTGARNTAVGYQSLQANTTGSNNVGVGYQSLAAATTASSNTAFGSGALAANVTGASLVAVGYQALRLATGNYNTALGSQALWSTTTGVNNVAVGSWAGYLATTGANNVNVGHYAGYAPNGVAANASTTASGQVCIGYQTGLASATQSNNIVAIGKNARAGGVSADSAVAIGDSAVATHAGSVALGLSSTTTAVDQIMVGPRDVEITLTTKGLVCKSPDGTRYRVQVLNGGALSTVAA